MLFELSEYIKFKVSWGIILKLKHFKLKLTCNKNAKNTKQK